MARARPSEHYKNFNILLYSSENCKWDGEMLASFGLSNGARQGRILTLIYQNCWICVMWAVWLVTKSSTVLSMSMTQSFLVYVVLGSSNR